MSLNALFSGENNLFSTTCLRSNTDQEINSMQVNKILENSKLFHLSGKVRTIFWNSNQTVNFW